ncbi:MerR family transcriptional regulator [Nannocystis bainbridge]|uniref:MerR family transcriptional regulator n=1 Tax=Nannocystis bainbridge TaxID=2995303 RepID=A0ABT5ED76_9BACT|nr:MerR family transcriptional regulator [Nannocystis bainbridge]MDC0723510.1 MerR family transcriptional regulator [Nannocystis bainbridge]
MALTVKQVASIAGVSVRTLHHYDEIGLLRPSGRSSAGYRLYSEADLSRLQQVLFFRALEFPLQEICRLMRDPEFDIGASLRMQRQLLREKAVRLQSLLVAVDAALARLGDERPMTNDEMKQMFDGFDPSVHEAEAQQRWGETEAYQESKRRAATYGKREWEAIKLEADATFARLAELMKAGVAPDAADAMDAAEAHRQHLERWFYPCSPAFHRGLGQLYVDDPRFTANIDKTSPGLAAYAAAAITANAGRAGSA